MTLDINGAHAKEAVDFIVTYFDEVWKQGNVVHVTAGTVPENFRVEIDCEMRPEQWAEFEQGLRDSYGVQVNEETGP